MSKNKWFVVAAGVVLWGYTLGHYLHGAYGYRGMGDFLLLLNVVRDWLRTGHFESSYVYLYPPIFYPLNIPLARLSDNTAVAVMMGINQLLLVVWVGLVWAAMLPGRLGKRWFWLFLPLVLNYRPLLLALSMAKIELLQLTLLSAAMLAFKRNAAKSAGALLALSGMLKPLPLILILYPLWKRQWRLVQGWVLTVGLLLAASCFLVGAQSVFAYFANLALPHGVNTIYWYEDQSLMGVAVRLFHPPQPQQYHLPPDSVSRMAVAFGWGMRLAVLAGLGFLLKPRRTDGEDRWVGEWSISFIGMLLLSPFSRDYYAVFLLPAYLFLAQALLEERAFRHPAAWLGIASYLLVGQGFPLGIVSRLPSPIAGVDVFHMYLHYGIPIVGYLLLLAAWVVVFNQAGSFSQPTGRQVALNDSAEPDGFPAVSAAPV